MGIAKEIVMEIAQEILHSDFLLSFFLLRSLACCGKQASDRRKKKGK